MSGAGLLVITVLLFVMAAGQHVLPASFIYVAVGIILIDVLVMMVLRQTICRKR